MPADAIDIKTTFSEAMVLLEDVRDHIAAGVAAGRGSPGALAPASGAAPEPAVRLRNAQELSRLTNRATAAVSLLLLLQALEEGQEVEVDNIPARVEAIFADVRTVGSLSPVDDLPPELTALLVRGDALFAAMPAIHARIVARLDGTTP